jgi:hypothetical protein
MDRQNWRRNTSRSVQRHDSSRHQSGRLKVTAKSYVVATRTAETRRVKTPQNSQLINTSNAVLETYSSTGRTTSFRDLEARTLVTATSAGLESGTT